MHLTGRFYEVKRCISYKYIRSISLAETMSKGVSISDEGADELTKVLIETGYGNEEEIATAILDFRPEIATRIYNQFNAMDENVRSIYGRELKLNDEVYYDPEELVS